MVNRNFERGRGGQMEWNSQGNGFRGQFGGQGRFGPQSGYGEGSFAGQGEYGAPGYGSQGQFGNPVGGQYGPGGYGEVYGRQVAAWQNREPVPGPWFGPGEGWQPGQGGSEGFGAESPAGYWRGQRQFGAPEPGAFGPIGGRLGEGFGARDYGAQGSGWQQAPGGYGDWGQGRERWEERAGEPGFWEQGQFGGPGYGSAGALGQSREMMGRGVGTPSAWSWTVGPYSGRGPRGYQRSDTRIEEDVSDRLTQHGMLDATDIQVRVQNGDVTLSGTVESRQAKRMAEDILDSVPGIRDVNNQLRVQAPIGPGLTDETSRLGSAGQGQLQTPSTSQRGEKVKAGATRS